MSCYFRHLKEVFAQAGVREPHDRPGRQRLDRHIRGLIGGADACPDAWRAIKAILADEAKREKFVSGLKGYGAP